MNPAPAATRSVLDLRRDPDHPFAKPAHLPVHPVERIRHGSTRPGGVVAALREGLKEKLSVGSQPSRGNWDKAISILTRIWATVPRELWPLRDEGIDLLRGRSPTDGLLVRWCMCRPFYSFFGTVANAVGRGKRIAFLTEWTVWTSLGRRSDNGCDPS